MIRALLLLLGFYLGLIGAVVHRHVDSIGPVQVPWGLVVGLFTVVVVAIAADQWTRLGSAYLAIGWALSLMLQSLGAGGSYLIATDLIGWGYSLGGLGALVAVVARNSRLRT